jgi:hydrogenase maturation protease
MAGTLIIGYGNPLRGDDAVGLLAAERLHELNRPDIEVLPVHQLTPELSDPISRANRVIFIDACVGQDGGEIEVRPLRPHVSVNPSFTHHATPEALLGAAQALFGRAPEACLLSVPGCDFSCSIEPTPRVTRRVEEVVAAVLLRIRRPLPQAGSG